MYLDKEPIDFLADVIEASHSQPVLVDFWAEWCGPCRILGPILEKLAKEAGDSWILVKLNTESQSDIAIKYEIRGIPAVKLFVQGEVAGEFMGALPEHQVRQWLVDSLPSKLKEKIAAAETALKQGDSYTAMLKAREVLKAGDADPEIEKLATVILAEASLSSDPEESRKLANQFEKGDPFFDRAEAVLTRYALNDGQLPEGKDSVACQLYVEGIKAWREGNEAIALERLIESFREDRNYMDDAARKSIIGIFQILGEEHETTRKYRPRFASVLF